MDDSLPLSPAAASIALAAAPVHSAALPEAAPASAPAPAAPDVADEADQPVGKYHADTPETYNPAEYRWVPVRRRARYDGWTEEKQRRFIEVLADTGIVTAAAKAVGMSRESAARLRRSPQGAAFARAWDAARIHAGSVLEDIAFERAIEGVAREVHDEYGNVVCTKRVYNDRLLTFLLGSLIPERYGRHAPAPGQAGREKAPSPEAALEASLRAMEPPLPAPPEALMDVETLEAELVLAEVADGTLSHFLREQRAEKSAEQVEAETLAAQMKRGKVAFEKGGRLSEEELADMCVYLDPIGSKEIGQKRFR